MKGGYHTMKERNDVRKYGSILFMLWKHKGVQLTAV